MNTIYTISSLLTLLRQKIFLCKQFSYRLSSPSLWFGVNFKQNNHTYNHPSSKYPYNSPQNNIFLLTFLDPFLFLLFHPIKSRLIPIQIHKFNTHYFLFYQIFGLLIFTFQKSSHPQFFPQLRYTSYSINSKLNVCFQYIYNAIPSYNLFFDKR